MFVTKHSQLRKLPCQNYGQCYETDDRITIIENLFKDSEKVVLGVIDSYIHNLNDPSCELIAHDCKGYSALHLAAERNMVTVAEKLLESGFNPLTIGCRENTGKLALHVAIEMGFDRIAALIIRHMKNTDVRDLFCNKTENQELVEFKHRSKTKDEPLGVFSVNYLIQKDFVKTIQAVFDSLKDVHDNRRCTVYVKLLEEDERGFEPPDKMFNVHHNTVFHNLNAQKELANHPVIGMLIDHKWEAWGRRKYVSGFLLYLMALFSLTFAIASGVTSDDVRKYDTSLQRSRGFFEVFICFCAFHRFVIEALEMKRHMLAYWKQFFNWIELLSTVCIFIVVLLRYTTENAHWFVLAVAYMVWVLRILKYAAIFRQTGIYAEALRQILTSIFVPFCLFFIVVNVAFGGTLLLVLKGEGKLNSHEETSSIFGIWFVGLRTMIEAGPIIEYTRSDGYGTSSSIVILVFMAMTIVVLLNILIAQLSDTYSEIQANAIKYNRANQMSILTRLERNEGQILHNLTGGCFRIFIPLRCCKSKTDNPSDRKKHYKSVFEDVDLQRKNQSSSTQIEDILENIYESNRAQIRTDHKVQIIKSRLRQLNKNIEDLTYLLDKKNKHDSDSDAETTNGSVSSRSKNEMSNRSSTDRDFENMSNSDTRELSGDEITGQNRKIVKGMNPYIKDAPSLEMSVTTYL